MRKATSLLNEKLLCLGHWGDILSVGWLICSQSLNSSRLHEKIIFPWSLSVCLKVETFVFIIIYLQTGLWAKIIHFILLIKWWINHCTSLQMLRFHRKEDFLQLEMFISEGRRQNDNRRLLLWTPLIKPKGRRHSTSKFAVHIYPTPQILSALY